MLAVVLVLAGALFISRVVAYVNAPGPRLAHIEPAPDLVHIVVTLVAITGTLGTPSAKQSRTVVYDRQFGTVAGQMYAQLISGERLTGSGGVMHCPSAAPTFYHYTLTFSRAGVQTAVATSDAQGCQIIELDYAGDGRDLFSWYDASNDTSFWVVLHQLTNAPLPIACVTTSSGPTCSSS